MTAFETKAMILSAVLKQERPFKAAKIFSLTDLDRSLIRYHLTNLVKEGALEKNGMYYAIADRDTLINLVANVSEGPRLRKPETTYILMLNTLHVPLELAVALRVLNHPVAQEFKAAINKGIDDSIKELKSARKYLNESRPMPRTAVRMVNDIDFDKFNYTHWLGKIQGKEEFLKILEEVKENVS